MTDNCSATVRRWQVKNMRITDTNCCSWKSHTRGFRHSDTADSSQTYGYDLMAVFLKTTHDINIKRGQFGNEHQNSRKKSGDHSFHHRMMSSVIKDWKQLVGSITCSLTEEPTEWQSPDSLHENCLPFKGSIKSRGGLFINVPIIDDGSFIK